MTLIDSLARKTLRSRLPALEGGTLALTDRDGRQQFGDVHARTDARGREPLHAALTVHSDAFYRRALPGSDIGIGESHMDGEWSTPDLVTTTRLMIRNAAMVEERGGLVRTIDPARWRHRAPPSRQQHRRQPPAHLRALRSRQRLLPAVPRRVADVICRRITRPDAKRWSRRSSTSSMRSAGSWRSAPAIMCSKSARAGSLRRVAATHYGCRVTTTTISEEQYRHAKDWVSRLGEAGSRIQVLLTDYRQLQGQFDKVVSIEMFEAVGLNHYDDYFGAVNRLLRPNGSMLLQTITVDEQHFPNYHGLRTGLKATSSGGERWRRWGRSWRRWRARRRCRSTTRRTSVRITRGR